MGHIFSEIFPFLASVFTHWQIWLSGGGIGGVIVLGATFVEKLRNKPLSKKAHVCVFLIAFFLCSCFLSWVDRDDDYHNVVTAKDDQAAHDQIKVGALQKQLDDLTKPDLHLIIDELGIGGLRSDGKTPVTAVFVTASLINKGAPSICDSWTMRIKLNDGRTDIGFPMLFKHNQHWSFNGNADISPEDGLYNKVGEHPVTIGEKVTGRIVFVFPRVEVGAGHEKGTTFTFDCHDVDGKTVEATQIFRNDKDGGEPQWYPGLTVPDAKKAQ